MEEIEVPTEHLHETIHEKVKEAGEAGWFKFVAISTALMAVFAAISGLMAGHYSNEALIEQIQASDQWSYYQAKGIKAEVKALQVKNGIADPAAATKYKTEQEEIKKEAEKFQQESKFHLDKHVILAQSVTLFQIAIAISAISILTKKKPLWIGSLLITLIGLGFFLSGFI
ncbi:MAG: hypothetical protein NVSMB63_16570 [Sediminibacterium sp.]